MLTVHAGFSSAKTHIVMGVLALALVVPGWAAAQAPERVVVFGTSLSDPGNAFALGGGTSTPPDFGLDPFLIPGAPYTGGGGGSHHFSNGPTWVEQLGRSLGLARSVAPALRDNNPNSSNYAVGGARARDVAGSFNLSAQLQAFLTDSGGIAPANALYVIEMGGNDLRDALAAVLVTQDPTAANPIIGGALTAIADAIQELYVRGARKFLVWNGPDIGLTPAIRPLGPVVAGIAGNLANGFNSNLGAVLNGLRAGLFGIDITVVDVHATLTAVAADPAAFDLSEAAIACLTPNVRPFRCKNADAFLFWDGIHPTTVGHGIIAQEAARVLPH